MSKYHSIIHNRQSIRLKDYDYSQAGFYFITICVQNRDCLFGKIENGIMNLNNAGMMVEKWYNEIEHKFIDIHCHEMIVMPNHFHCIFENIGEINIQFVNNVCFDGENICSPLHVVVQWFKTMTTNDYIRGVKSLDWQPFSGKLWQRNYWEHIIRNERSYQAISDYIRNNPSKWIHDQFYTI